MAGATLSAAIQGPSNHLRSFNQSSNHIRSFAALLDNKRRLNCGGTRGQTSTRWVRGAVEAVFSRVKEGGGGGGEGKYPHTSGFNTNGGGGGVLTAWCTG
jgi:hypothetical protein